MNPTVSFIVPCYKLAHLLPQCLDSILGQSFGDFEVLIMDDHSPDATETVARQYSDKRLQYVRNPKNLGHLRNYNEGITRAQGKYIWLISADDYLRRPYALEKYVALLEKNPKIGFAFCPAVRVTDRGEGEVLAYSKHGNRDRNFHGPTFLKQLIIANRIVAASGIVRRECYDNISVFPLDMPWAGDWYLWCLFALHYDVGYLAEPLVCYRTHQLSMTNTLMQGGLDGCAAEDVAMPWVIRRKAIEANHPEIEKSCLKAAAAEYSRSCSSQRYRTSTSVMAVDRFEASLDQNAPNEKAKQWIRARVYAGLADRHFWDGDLPKALQLYAGSIKNDPRWANAWVKWLLLRSGRVGVALRTNLAALRRHAASLPVRIVG